MTQWLHLVAMILLASLAVALWRVWRGPSQADRVMALQLVGTGGVAVLVVLAAVQDWTLLVVALALALLAALAAVGFVQAETPDGAGDPEEHAPRGKPKTKAAPARAGTEPRRPGGGPTAQGNLRPADGGQAHLSAHRHPERGRAPRAAVVQTAGHPPGPKGAPHRPNAQHRQHAQPMGSSGDHRRALALDAAPRPVAVATPQARSNGQKTATNGATTP